MQEQIAKLTAIVSQLDNKVNQNPSSMPEDFRVLPVEVPFAPGQQGRASVWHPVRVKVEAVPSSPPSNVKS